MSHEVRWSSNSISTVRLTRNSESTQGCVAVSQHCWVSRKQYFCISHYITACLYTGFGSTLSSTQINLHWLQSVSSVFNSSLPNSVQTNHHRGCPHSWMLNEFGCFLSDLPQFVANIYQSSFAEVVFLFDDYPPSSFILLIFIFSSPKSSKIVYKRNINHLVFNPLGILMWKSFYNHQPPAETKKTSPPLKPTVLHCQCNPRIPHVGCKMPRCYGASPANVAPVKDPIMLKNGAKFTCFSNCVIRVSFFSGRKHFFYSRLLFRWDFQWRLSGIMIISQIIK